MPQIYNSHILLQPVTLEQVHHAIRAAVMSLPWCALAVSQSRMKYMVNAMDKEGVAQTMFKIHVVPDVAEVNAVWLNFVPARTPYSQSRASSRAAFCETYAHLLDDAAIQPFIVKGAVHPAYEARYVGEILLDAALARQATSRMKPLPPPAEDTEVPVHVDRTIHQIFPLLFTADRLFAFKCLLDLDKDVTREANVGPVVSSFMYVYVSYARPSLAELYAAWKLCKASWLFKLLSDVAVSVCAKCEAKGWHADMPVDPSQQPDIQDYGVPPIRHPHLPCIVCCAVV